MKRPGAVRHSKGAALLLAACIGSGAAATAQETSLRDLQAQVRDLHAAVTEMLGEVARSRQEAQELRRELQAAREEVASFNRELAASRRQPRTGNGAALPIATGANAGAAARFAANTSSALAEFAVGDPAQSGQALPSERVTALDSRVATLADDQQLLTAKVEDQYQTKVESGSKYRVRLSGLALLNVFGTRGSVDTLDLPSAAVSRGPLDSLGTFGATVRQSLLGLEVFGPNLAGAKASGDIQFDFFGGFPYTTDGVTAGLVRLRTARISLDWNRTSIIGGQDAPLFSPLSPSSLASIAYPAFSTAGNLWVWTPQIRVEHRAAFSDASSIVLQGGIMDPLTGELPGFTYFRLPQAGERSGGPAYAARTAWKRTAFDRSLTVGAGAYYARHDWGYHRIVNAWAATADWDLPLGRWFSLSGEFYRGRAIGGLGAASGRSVLFSGPPANTTTSVLGLGSSGGWSQMKFKPLEKMEFNGAFGEDVPFTSELRRFRFSQFYFEPSYGRNASAMFNVIYHARSNLLLSVEYRRLWTSQLKPGKSAADHVNFGAGVLF